MQDFLKSPYRLKRNSISVDCHSLSLWLHLYPLLFSDVKGATCRSYECILGQMFHNSQGSLWTRNDVQRRLRARDWGCGSLRVRDNLKKVKSLHLYFFMLRALFSRISTWITPSSFVIFWPHWEACGILAPGIEPIPSAVKDRRPNPWTAREFPLSSF